MFYETEACYIRRTFDVIFGLFRALRPTFLQRFDIFIYGHILEKKKIFVQWENENL